MHLKRVLLSRVLQQTRRHCRRAALAHYNVCSWPSTTELQGSAFDPVPRGAATAAASSTDAFIAAEGHGKPPLAFRAPHSTITTFGHQVAQTRELSTASTSPGRQGARWAQSARVHPSAVVSSSAELGEGAVVGPHAVVGPQVVVGAGTSVGAGAQLVGRTALGAHCTVREGAVLGSEDPGTTILGAHNTIGHHACIGVRCQDRKYGGGECHLLIGAGNDIRELVQIHRSSLATECTRLGDRNLLMAGCHVAHDCHVGSDAVLGNYTLLGGHVHVGDRAVLGGAVAVKPFCHVGELAFVAGGAMVEGSVPACLRAKGDRAELRGVNFEGLRRAGHARAAVLRCIHACSALFRDGLGGGGTPADAQRLALRARQLLRSSDAEPAAGAPSRWAGVPHEASVEPAVMMLTSVIDWKRTDRSPAPCPWRRTAVPGGDQAEIGVVAELAARVEGLEAQLALLIGQQSIGKGRVRDIESKDEASGRDDSQGAR